MNLRICLLSIIGLLCAGDLHAQDKIYKRNGDVIDGKIKEVGTKTISYKKGNNPDGPNYTINKAEIDHVKYENGEEEFFYDNRRPPFPGSGSRNSSAKQEEYGNNILSVSPIQVSDNGVGIALSYERVLDKRGIVSFYLPVAIAFNNNNSGYYYGDNGDYQTYYFMPGIKFYPTGSRGIVKYAVGPNLAFVTGRENYEVYRDPYAPYNTYYDTRDFFLFGMMVTNSLNINPTPRLHMALELGLGFSYTDNRNDSYNSYDYNDPIPLAQFGFQIGYRF